MAADRRRSCTLDRGRPAGGDADDRAVTPERAGRISRGGAWPRTVRDQLFVVEPEFRYRAAVLMASVMNKDSTCEHSAAVRAGDQQHSGQNAYRPLLSALRNTCPCAPYQGRAPKMPPP